MLRKPLLSLFILLVFQQSIAQHADLGTGALKNQIWWLNWAGVTIANGATKTFVTNDGLAITAVISNATTQEPVPTVMTSNYFGSMLHLLYDFSDPTILPSLYVGVTTGVQKFSMTVTATRLGVPVPFYLVTADAEASWDGEITTIKSNGSNWQCITLFNNSALNIDPLTGCGSQAISIHDTFDGNASEGQNPIVMTQAPVSGPLNLDVTYDHGTTTGGMALAFGVLQSEDRGDLNSNYGTAQHQLNYTVANACAYPTPLPALTQDVSLMIGSVPGDADPIQYADDNAIGVDEEGVSSFSVYDNSGTYAVNLTVGNTSGADAWLTGWFDYNRDGSFQPNEAATIVIPNNATSATIIWNGLPQYLPQGSANGYGFRFRLSSDKQATQQATGFARDGEVEDYFVTPETLCTPVVPAITAAPQPLCIGQSLPLQASGGSTYSWSPATGLSDPTIGNPIASPQSTTTYTVTAATPQGCTGNASVTITTLPSPVITAGNNATVCENDPVTLNASGGVTYTWTSADPTFQATGPTIPTTPSQSTDYTVTGTGSNGCTASATVSIIVHQLPVFGLTPPDTTVCTNSTLELKASGGDQYTWQSSTGAPLGSNPTLIVNPGANTTIQVTITDDICQLSSTLTAIVNIRPLPELSITSSNIIDCKIGQATLRVTGANSYQWQPLPGITSLFSADPVVTPVQTTTYYVKGTDANGCSSLDSVNVKVNDASDPSSYPIPSAFTPNNDGVNDCFSLKYWGHITSLELSVFNRWGQRVFFTTDPQTCWDGTFKGIPQPAGGYAYQIKATTACGTAYRKGIVILVR